MIKCYITALFLAIAMSLSAQTSPEIYSQIRIDLTTGSGWEGLNHLDIETDHGILVKGKTFTHVYDAEELAIISNAGFTYEVLIPDMKEAYKQLQLQGPPSNYTEKTQTCNPSSRTDYYPTPDNYEAGSMGGYQTYSEMMTQLHAMHLYRPDLITDTIPLSDTILTFQGRKLYMLRMSDQPDVDENEPEVLYTALHHAREPNSLSQLLFFMWYMLENYDTDPEVKYLLDETELYFVPCVNPDGYVYNETTNPDGGGNWRKNRRPNSNGTVGVDLNRNYGYQWGLDDTGSSPNPNSATYRGTAPFSEPETRLIRDLCLAHEFQIAMNYHTYGNLMNLVWGYTYDLAEDRPSLDVVGEHLSQRVNYVYGAAEILYTTNGDSNDWMYGDESKNKIFAFTPEVGPGEYGFWPPSWEINRLNTAAMASNMRTAHMAHAYGILDVFPPVTTEETNQKIPFRFRSAGLSADPITISLTALTANVIATDAPLVYELPIPGVAESEIGFTLAEGTPENDVVGVVLSWSNGLYTERDTIFMLVANGVDLLSGAGFFEFESTGAWTTFMNEGNFGRRIQGANAQSSIPFQLEYVKSLPDTSAIWLEYTLEYGIEPISNSYLSLELGTNTGNIQPVCAKYTTINDNTANSPQYQGRQLYTVLERIDVSEYQGQDLTMRFEYRQEPSFENNVTLKNIRLVATSLVVNGNEDVNASSKAFLMPNPVDANGIVKLNVPDIAQIDIWDLAGSKWQQINSSDLNNQAFKLNDCPKGLYVVKLTTNDGEIHWQKLIIK